MYENLEDDDLDEYDDSTNPWKLDCVATNNFVGEQTGILERKKVENGFEVMVANGVCRTVVCWFPLLLLLFIIIP